MNSIKSLVPALVLVAIYFIADEFFGPEVSVCTALIIGTGEFIYTRTKEKVYDKVILWTTLFFCVPGLISIFAEGSIAARLQPAIIETALCLLLGFFAFSHSDLKATLPTGYRKNLNVSAEQMQRMRQTLRTLFFILCVHTVFSYIALLFLPPATADFISSPLLYILMAGFFVFLFVRNRWMAARMKKEEWLPLVNEKGEVTGQAPRSVCHSGRKLLHPVVHLHIINNRQEVFLQKRSMKKDLLPGIWDTAVGGHIGVNEKVEEALKRESFEELGITDFEAGFLGSYVWESPHERELVFSFLCTRYNEICIDNEEVDEGRFWSRHEVEEGIGKGLFTPNFVHEFSTILNKSGHFMK